MLYPYNEMPYSNKNEETTNTYNDKDKSHKHNMEWEKQKPKEHILHDSTDTEFKSWQN